MSGRARRRRRIGQPCPSWCRGHFNVRGGPVHYRLAAVVERPGRHLTPMEQLTTELTGRTPGYVEVSATQIKDGLAQIGLTVFGHQAVLTAEEAMSVGESLLALGITISAATGADSPTGT